ncbi:MAG: nucleotide exchange factor GrpE [Eubacterium sp.]|nr:nucleotide exchange factor GrpE [Eubacterium sp.]
MMDSNLDKEKIEETVENAEEVKEETVETVEEVKEEATETDEKTQEETLEEKLVKAEEQVKEAQDKWLRQLAEFENFRKRTNQEKQGMYNNGVRDTIEKFLPVVDNFERAVVATEDKESSTYKGIEMILKQMLDVMKAIGVEEIPAEGELFDPNVHAAVMHIEDESCDDNVVVEVFQKGYKHGDKVIRPAMVKVAN